MDPEAAMVLALRAARTASGRTHPNPAVGAVVFRGDRVLGRGATRPPPGAHAEIVALERARRRHGPRALAGASVAVTLEPCAHWGRTGPCVDALIEAGVRFVYVGCRDPFPEVRGRGLRRLRRGNVEVRTGVLEAECREQHRGFFSVHERGRPFVSLKMASSLDGRIATAAGESRWITGPEARRRVQALRGRSDAVMVGSGTALADDPELVARRGSRIVHRPVRVLVDGRLRVPARARLYREAGRSPTWVLCAGNARGRSSREAGGAQLLSIRRRGEHLDLGAALERLAREGLTEVLVEGGGELAAALLRRGLVDEVHWFVAPRLLGGDGRAALGPLALRRLEQAARLRDTRVARVGADVHFSGRVTGAAEGT